MREVWLRLLGDPPYVCGSCSSVIREDESVFVVTAGEMQWQPKRRVDLFTRRILDDGEDAKVICDSCWYQLVDVDAVVPASEVDNRLFTCIFCGEDLEEDEDEEILSQVLEAISGRAAEDGVFEEWLSQYCHIACFLEHCEDPESFGIDMED